MKRHVMDHLQNLGFDMITIGSFIDDKNLNQSYQLIQENPNMSKSEFLNRKRNNKIKE